MLVFADLMIETLEFGDAPVAAVIDADLSHTGALRHSRLRLPPSYNMQAAAKFTEWWNSALVRHYCGPRKFMPPSLFRNDGKDVRYLKRIGKAAGLQAPGSPRSYEILFRLNVLRQRRKHAPILRFLHAVEAQTTISVPAAPRGCC